MDDQAQIGLLSLEPSTFVEQSRPLEQPSPEQLDAVLHHSASGADTRHLQHLQSAEQSIVYMDLTDLHVDAAVCLYNEMCPMAIQLLQRKVRSAELFRRGPMQP